MSTALRKWATPLTFATSLVVGVTGVLLFFHTGSSLSRVAHEWLGFAMLAAVALHVVLNWRPFQAYLKRPLARFIMVAGVVLTMLTAVNFSDPANRAPSLNPGQVFGALQRAPVSALAEVAGKDPAAFAGTLRARGYDNASPEASATEIAGGDSAASRTIMALAFAPDE